MSQELDELYVTLMSISDITTLSSKEAIDKIAILVDLSTDLNKPEGIDRAVQWTDLIEKSPISNGDKSLLEYFRANAWAGRIQIKMHQEKQKQEDEQQEQGKKDEQQKQQAWAWEQSERQEEILCLRRAINHSGFNELEDFRRCQILTNLANQYSQVGRFVEAHEYWGRALAIIPEFGMAVGNKGYNFYYIGKSLYDAGHQGVFLVFAHSLLTQSLSAKAIYQGDYRNAKETFKNYKDWIEKHVNIKKLSKSFDLHDHKMGESKEEQAYRDWCLRSCLFLSPLNDLGPYPIANHDVLMLPPYVTANGEPPTWIGFYNQMKQEYISARWFYYEGIHSNSVHFADKDVLLYNTLDYPSYSIAIEKVKAAFRIGYSIFDKIGFFLNDYMDMGVKPNKVSFKKIWFENSDKDRSKWQISPKFSQSENWPFRGLFWLSKDLFEDDFINVTEPDAMALSEIRNHLEHKYLKIHEILIETNPTDDLMLSMVDRMAYSIKREDFEAKTLRILKLARAALFYLSLGMHKEEKRRRKDKNEDLIAPMALDTFDDEQKQ